MEWMLNLMTVGFVSLLAAISPGPDFVVVVKNSLSNSRKIGLFTSLGVCIALLFHITYTIVGIGVLLAENPFFYLLVTYLGAAYLFYIGCKGFVSSFKKQPNLAMQLAGQSKVAADQPINQDVTSQASSTGKSMTSMEAFKQGFLTNLLNPKCAIFFVSLFSQFILPGTPLSLKLGYACINWLVTLGWFCLLCYLITGNYILSRIGKFRAMIDRVMGVILMLLSLKIIFF